MNGLQHVLTALKHAKHAAILSHVSPDGDCIGSMAALGRALEHTGCEVVLVNNDPIPAYLTFLLRTNQVVLPQQVTEWPPLIICVDCSDQFRLGERVFDSIPADRMVVNIDHHISNTNFGSVNYVDPSAAATGELVAQVIKQLNIEFDTTIATALYAAVVTDTGSFQYSNTTSATHLLIAELIEAGVDVVEASRRLYNTKTLAEVKLLGKALDNLEVSADGRMAWITVPQQVFRSLGATEAYTDGIINYTRALENVEVGLLFREQENGKIKVGFRSKRVVDVNRLAAEFGGGGHPRAAGCVIKANLSDAVAAVLSKTKEYLEALNERNNQCT